MGGVGRGNAVSDGPVWRRGPDTLVEAAERGRAGLIKDKVSVRGHFGLQTEGNICVNLSTTGSPLQRGMQREIERRAGREPGGYMSMHLKKKKKKDYWRDAFKMKT